MGLIGRIGFIELIGLIGFRVFRASEEPQRGLLVLIRFRLQQDFFWGL